MRAWCWQIDQNELLISIIIVYLLQQYYLVIYKTFVMLFLKIFFIKSQVLNWVFKNYTVECYTYSNSSL